MIAYTQNLTELPQAGQSGTSEVVLRRLSSVEGPMIITGIPFDQPDPEVSQALKHLALYLEGIHQVSFPTVGQ